MSETYVYSAHRSLDPHHVYTFWQGSTPLYVGCTVNLQQRMREHRRTVWMSAATWIAWVTFPDRNAGLMAEAERISKLRPHYNIRYNPGRDRVVDRLAAELAYQEWSDEIDDLEAKWLKHAPFRVLGGAA